MTLEAEQFVSDETRAVLAALMADPDLTEVRARPGFEDVSRDMVAIWREHTGEDDKAYAHNLRDLGRFASGILALYLHSTPGGLTVSRLSALMVAANIAGFSRARALLLYLQFLGYVAPVARGGDRREKQYVATQRLIGAITTRLVREFTAMARVSPPIAGMLPLFDQPGAFDIYAEAMGESWLAYMGRREEQPGPSLEIFSQRYAGMLLLSELLATAEPGDAFPPKGPMRYSVAALARNAGISRTQVRRMLRAGADAGFLILPEEGLALPTELLRKHVDLVTAANILGHSWCAEQFLRRIRQKP